MKEAEPLPVAEPPPEEPGWRLSLEGQPVAEPPREWPGWLLSLEGQWFRCAFRQGTRPGGGPLWLFKATGGSPAACPDRRSCPRTGPQSASRASARDRL